MFDSYEGISQRKSAQKFGCSSSLINYVESEDKNQLLQEKSIYQSKLRTSKTKFATAAITCFGIFKENHALLMTSLTSFVHTVQTMEMMISTRVTLHKLLLA